MFSSLKRVMCAFFLLFMLGIVLPNVPALHYTNCACYHVGACNTLEECCEVAVAGYEEELFCESCISCCDGMVSGPCGPGTVQPECPTECPLAELPDLTIYSVIVNGVELNEGEIANVLQDSAAAVSVGITNIGTADVEVPFYTALYEGLCGAPPAGAPYAGESENIEITYRFGGGASGWSSVVIFYNDGTIRSEDLAPVTHELTTREGQMARDELLKFVSFISSQGFFDMADEYACSGSCPTDMPRKEIEVTVGERTKKISIASSQIPDGLTAILNVVDEYRSQLIESPGQIGIDYPAMEGMPISLEVEFPLQRLPKGGVHSLDFEVPVSWEPEDSRDFCAFVDSRSIDESNEANNEFQFSMKAVGQVSECTPGETRQCGPDTNAGSCEFGTQLCGEDEQWGECEGAIYPTNEVCSNGLDDDCDGTIDEEDCELPCTPGETRQCGPEADAGICEFGSQLCNDAGAWGQCDGAVYPATEVCGNGLDDDCDGTIDEADCFEERKEAEEAEVEEGREEGGPPEEAPPVWVLRVEKSRLILGEVQKIWIEDLNSKERVPNVDIVLSNGEELVLSTGEEGVLEYRVRDEGTYHVLATKGAFEAETTFKGFVLLTSVVEYLSSTGTLLFGSTAMESPVILVLVLVLCVVAALLAFDRSRLLFAEMVKSTAQKRKETMIRIIIAAIVFVVPLGTVSITSIYAAIGLALAEIVAIFLASYALQQAKARKAIRV
jgi:hypothetical protein